MMKRFGEMVKAHKPGLDAPKLFPKVMVAGEDAAHPLSDARLVEMLALSGIRVARRTVAKYRELMRIPPAAERMRRR